jgi:hypothetical protein
LLANPLDEPRLRAAHRARDRAIIAAPLNPQARISAKRAGEIA